MKHDCINEDCEHYGFVHPYNCGKEPDVESCSKATFTDIKDCKKCDNWDAGNCEIGHTGCVETDHWTPRRPKMDYKVGPFVEEIDNPYQNQIGGDHYKKAYPFCQPLEFFSKNNIPFTKANVCKYVLRYDLKNGIEDLRKAKHYLEVIAWDEYQQVL